MAFRISGAISRAQSVLEFAQWLQHALDQTVQDIPALATHLEALKSSFPHDATIDERSKLHQAGVELWNKCRRDDIEESIRDKAVLAEVMSFAYLILRKPCERIAVCAARACIVTKQYPLAVTILERISKSSSIDYVLLRILLAWRQDKPSIADLFFSKIKELNDEHAKENAIGLFYEIGFDYLDNGQHEQAKKWLERAYNTLGKWDLSSSFDGLELRLNVLHTYARSLFASGQDDETTRLVLNMLRSEYPQRLPVLLLQMEHYADPNDLQITLKATIQTMQLMDSTFKLVIHHLHVLRKLDLDRAIGVLTYYIIQRLIPEGTRDWTEAAIMTFVWMVAQDLDDCDRYTQLIAYFDAFHEVHRGKEPLLSQETNQAAIVLLWKRIEKLFETDPSAAAKWCQAICLVFGGSDEQTIAKIKRKLVACHIATENWEQARYELDHIPESGKADNLTRYLNYSVAIRSNDEEAAERALSTLASTPKDANKLLFACVSETNKHGRLGIQAKVLQRILDKYSNDPHPDINICTLLRATARLLWQVLEQKLDEVDEEILERLCAIFKAAKNYSVKCNGQKASVNETFSALECEWFSKNGYNLALQRIQQWPTRYIARILENVSNIRYPKDIGKDVQERRQNRNANIVYVRIVLYTTEARNRDKAAYKKVMTVYNDSIVNGKGDQVFASLLPLIFEAAIHSTSTDQQGTLSNLLTLLPSESPKFYAACADLVFSSALRTDETCLPLDVAVALLNQIISHLRVLPDYDIAQASRWVRCMVQLIFDTSRKTLVEDTGCSSLALLKSIIEETAQLIGSAPYPKEELEWLATMVFNLAVDLYVAEKDDAGKDMAMLSLPFAMVMEDKGLERILRDKMDKIGW